MPSGSIRARAAAPLGAKDIRLAVLEFENNTGRQDVEHLKKGLRDFFVTDLQELSGVTLVERGRIDEVLKEIKMTRSKYFDPATAAKMGKQMGASHVLTGSYFCMNKRWRMDIRVVSAETGEVLVTGKQDGTEDDVFDMEKALVETMAKKLKPDLSRRELRKLNRPQTEKYASFDKYSRAVDKAESGDREGAVRLMEEVAREDKRFSLAVEQLEKYQAKLQQDIEQHAKSSKEGALSDLEYVERDFQNSLKQLQTRDNTPDYYASILIAAFHYSLRDRRKHAGKIQKLLEKYEAEFLCETHSPQTLKETAEKLDRRLLSLENKICEYDFFNGKKQVVDYKDHFKKVFDKFPKTYVPVLYWPSGVGSASTIILGNNIFGTRTVGGGIAHSRRDDWSFCNPLFDKHNILQSFRSYICVLYFIFNHHLHQGRHKDIPGNYTMIVDGFGKTHMSSGDASERYLTMMVYSTMVKSPHPGVVKWDDIVIKTLRDLELYEKNDKKRIMIKKALVLAIELKKRKGKWR